MARSKQQATDAPENSAPPVISDGYERVTAPMIPMRNMNVFPGVSLTFEIARPRSRAAVHEAMDHNHQMVFLLAQRSLSKIFFWTTNGTTNHRPGLRTVPM